MDGKNVDVAAADFCLRSFCQCLEQIYLEKNHKTGLERFTGKIFMCKPTPKILLRNSSFIENGKLYLMLVIRFPVHMMEKRNVIAGKLSVRIVQKELSKAIRDFIALFDLQDYEHTITVYKRQQELRSLLTERKLVCFIANGSILPRTHDELPLTEAVPFQSPPEDEYEFILSDGFAIKGMGIPQGIAVITGGGYSGKSTLLDGILAGIYDHIPGDGREYCLSNRNSCKIIAEDGRSVTALDISPFIRNITYFNTECFTSRHASGSTSQASNIMEAIAFGCEALLIDEDRTATNFMIRDTRMKQLIQEDPIIPFTDRVREIYREAGISTVLVIGGTSEYLDLADHVYMMKGYRLYNYDKEISAIRQPLDGAYQVFDENPIWWKLARKIKAGTFSAFKRDAERNRIFEHISVQDKSLHVGENIIDVSKLDSIISSRQITAIGLILRHIANAETGETFDVYNAVKRAYDMILNQGLDAVHSSNFDIMSDLELPTLHDICFAISRMSSPEYIP